MKRLKIAISLMGILLILGIVGSFSSETYDQIKSDLEKLKTEEYDTVFSLCIQRIIIKRRIMLFFAQWILLEQTM